MDVCVCVYICVCVVSKLNYQLSWAENSCILMFRYHFICKAFPSIFPSYSSGRRVLTVFGKVWNC